MTLNVNRASLLPWPSFVQLILTLTLHYLGSCLALVSAFLVFPLLADIRQAVGPLLIIYLIIKQIPTEFLSVSGTVLGTWDAQLNKTDKNP